MPETNTVRILINGVNVDVLPTTSVAAAVMGLGFRFTRLSVTGETRAPLCGMGICYECRLTINGQLHERSCQIFCATGMDVRTDQA